ncbi:dihydrofolate reductase family protein [Streptomyces sp. NPDC020917]|uniref:dihydrofolate reductase family protein n=1 Tax=Streptomyces sp. NPDC020917 TaxID=3365102 RepID=UPI00379D1741
MGTIVISTNITLDGVVTDPDGQEGAAGGGWFTATVGDDRPAWAEHETREVRQAAALMVGRHSDAWFASRWNARLGEWAERMGALPKYVVSATLDEPRWNNATVLGGDPVKEAAELKRRVDGEIVVYGSRRLARALIEHDLADELRLTVFPVVAGGGGRLFDEEGPAGTKRLRLLESRPLGAQLHYQAYAFVR